MPRASVRNKDGTWTYLLGRQRFNHNTMEFKHWIYGKEIFKWQDILCLFIVKIFTIKTVKFYIN